MELKTSTFSKFLSLIFVIVLFANINISAQAVRIGAGAGTPDASAILDIVSTTSGILIPRMTEAQRTNAAFDLSGNPVGVLVYQTDGAVPGFYYYNGTDWQNLYGGTVPTIPGESEYWLRPNSDPTYIYPEGNTMVKIYDSGETYGVFYDGGLNQYGLYGRTTNVTDPTAAVVGFSDVSGNQTYGYLGYNGTYNSGTSFGSLDGMAVYGMVEDPSRAAIFGRTTNNASVAAIIGYSDTWSAGFYHVDYDDGTSNFQGALATNFIQTANAEPSGVGSYIIPAISGYFGFDGSGGDDFGVGVEGYANIGDQYGIGVYGHGSAGSNGIIGKGNGLTNFFWTGSGDGVIGGSDAGVGVLGYFNDANSTQYGILGYSNLKANYFYHEEAYSNDGQAAIYAYRTRTGQNDGTGYAEGVTNQAIEGYAYWGDAYTFGVSGFNYNDNNRSGGMLGANQGGSYWSALGYKNSGGNNYGLCYIGGLTTTAKDDDIKTGIGFGGVGNVMGGWTKGDVYGFTTKGDRYSLYVDGKQYTNDVITQLSENGKNERIATYVPTSMTVDIYMKGTGTLVNGKAIINFDKKYTKLISDKEPVIVTVTPMGQTNGVYIESVKSSGFSISENNAGKSNTNFTWIAIATRKGYENPENPVELLSNEYDNTMDGVMFNENDTENSATPIWWDGKKVRFDVIPKEKKEKAEYIPKKKIVEVKIDSLKESNSNKLNK